MKIAIKPAALLAAMLFCLPLAAQAAAPAYQGQPPSRLLKTAPGFAKAVKSLINEADLPAWTQKMAMGFPAERVEIDGKELWLTSACNPVGCYEERFYVLFDAKTRSASGFFFLPPSVDTPGDTRMAFSRWLGSPERPASDFLMERAMKDLPDQVALPPAK